MNKDSKTQIAKDLHEMHDKYGIHTVVDAMDKETLLKFADFRAACIEEELEEFISAIADGNAEEMVDALIDVIVFAVGTLDLFKVNFDAAWKTVHDANMNKKVGIKPGRSNPMGLPDLLKPEGWQSPDHSENHGKFEQLELDL